jgi:hypothetical protein
MKKLAKSDPCVQTIISDRIYYCRVGELHVEYV